MDRRGSLALRIGVAVVALALVAGGTAVVLSGNGQKRVTGYFEQAVGLYEGSSVRVLGVDVGEITRVEPQGNRVRVEMVYDAEHRVPANAKAAVIAPTLVSGRYVQLAPVYEKGPVLQDGATIPLSRTATPVELDEVYSAVNELSTALGPQGANKDGALSRLLEVSADNLEGQGANLNRTVEELSKAAETLSSSRKDMFGTVRNLQKFTTALAESDDRVESFNRDLAKVSSQLEGERDELRAALDRLSVALQKVEGFVRQNREEIKTNVEDLTEVTEVVAEEKEALSEVLGTGALALSNLALAYNPEAGTLDTRINLQQVQDPAMYLCSLVYSLGAPPEQCEPLLQPLNAVRMDNPPVGLDASKLLPSGESGGDAGGGPPSPDVEPDPSLGGLLPGDGLLSGGDQ